MLRVFLVEDESIIRETLRDTVPWAQCGYTFVGEASDGEMALPLIRQTRPDVLITDIRMPFMDGLALSKLVLQEFPKMKIIIISGYDDFEYARQAISIGVERYLLKPITKNSLLTVLGEVRDKIEGEQARQNYLDQFHEEAQEYEQYARRSFFERVVTGQLTDRETYDQAEKLDLDLRAQCYTIAFFSILPERHGMAESYSELSAQLRDSLLSRFLKYPEFILLRWNMTTYAVLIKGSGTTIGDSIRRCTESVQEQYETLAPDHSWYVAVGRPVQQLNMLPGCFDEVARLWSYRHIFPMQHVFTSDTVHAVTGSLANLDVTKVKPAIITGVLQSASVEEVPSFVDEYLHSVEDALESKPFCQYLMLSFRFTATEYLQSLDISPQEFVEKLNCLDLVGQNVTIAELKRYMADILLRALELRDRASNTQYRSLLKQAVDYIDSNFAGEDLSLNKVAREVNISANYLSAVFSQEMGITFTEYVTGKRMEKAKELLRTTDKRSGEVALAVGYRDPHYFSFLFKKTQGCTPRDYRSGKDKR